MSDVPKDVAKLWTAVLTLKTWAEGEVRRIGEILVGVNGNNGIKGDLKVVREEQTKLEEKIDALEKHVDDSVQKAWHLWEVERYEPGKCIGANEVRKLEAKIDADRKRDHEAEDARNADRSRERREARRLQYTLIGAILTSLIASVPSWIEALHKATP